MVLLLLIAMTAAKLTASSVISSAVSEQNFSLDDHVVSARSTLISSTVNNILFMNSAIHHTK